MAESPCPARRQGPTGGRGQRRAGSGERTGTPQTDARRPGAQAAPPFFPWLLAPGSRLPGSRLPGSLAPGAQARPIWPRPPPPIFRAPFRSFPALAGPQHPGAIPCVAPGKRLEWAPSFWPQKPGARTKAGAAAYPVSRQGLGYRSPGPVRRALRQTPGLEALQSIEGRSQARPAPRPYPGGQAFPPCPAPLPGQRTGDPGPKAGQAPETGLARSFAPFPDGNPWRPSPQNGNRP